MATKRKDNVPGSPLEKIVDLVWYGVIITLWLGFLSFIDEFFWRVEKYNYEALPKRSGETVVLTGGTRGIGLEVLKKLLRLDYRVIIGVRNPSVGMKVVEQIRKTGISTGTAKCFPLDLKSLRSVRNFAKTVLKETDRIDLLINNAGIMFESYEITEDGFESHFQVNYLSHFLLTQLLLPKIKQSAAKRSSNCRIINLSSLAHKGAFASNIQDAANPKIYSRFRAYFDSKLCQVISTKHMDKMLKSEGANVNVYALHPGVIPTDLYSSISFLEWTSQKLKMFFRNTDDGSEIVMYTAISTDLEHRGGSYIASHRVQSASKVADDNSLQEHLWSMSQDFIKKKR